MSEVPDMLGGVTMSAAETRAQLAQIGRTTDCRLPGRCKACSEMIEFGSPIERCLRWGWCHASCRREAEAALP